MELEDIAELVEGVWLPKGEKHLREWMTTGKKAVRINDKITYQWGKQMEAMQVCDHVMPDWQDGVFVDVGAHCGFWSMWWGTLSKRVVAFEPIPEFREIYRANLPPEVDYDLHPFALGNAVGKLDIRVDPTNTGGTRALADGEKLEKGHRHVVADLETLDRVLPGALGKDRMTVLKIDCEGFEENVIRGGEVVIDKHRPVIVVEQKFESKWFGYERHGAVRHLTEHKDYKSVKEIGGDFIMVPEEFL